MKRLECALLLFALAAVPLAAQQPLDLQGLPQTKSAPQFPKLDTGLNRILLSDDAPSTAESLGYRMRDGKIQVVIQVAEGAAPDLEIWLEENGSLFVESAGDLVQAFVSMEVLKELGHSPIVWSVRRPRYVDHVPTRSAAEGQKFLFSTSEGVQAMNAGPWHNAGFTGQGAKVVVIDEGFVGAAGLLGTELPPAARVFSQVFGGGNPNSTEHGTACAEVIYDVAPGLSELYLFTVGSEVDIVNAIDRARQLGIDVASMSENVLTWGPNDGTGQIPEAIGRFNAAGGIFSVSAGNARMPHWQGTWLDSNGDGYLDFSHGLNVNYFLETDGSTLKWFLPLTTITVRMIWNQWNAPATDLDLHLVRWDGSGNPEVVASSENFQSGQAGQLPVEEITYLTILGGYFGFAIQYFSGPTSVDIEIEARRAWNPFQTSVPSGSVLCPGDAEDAITVGAVDAASPYALEPYSSKGPTNGPGGSINGGAVKPDLAAYANVSTSSFGPRSPGTFDDFDGTSAACPHVAGAAALVWSAYPNWSNAQIRSFLESNARDMGPGGKDNDYGFGRLWLGNPPASCTYSISPTSASYGASGGSGSFQVSTQAGCTWTASSNNSWIHITGGSSGTGNGTVSYSVDANGSSSSRTGTITAAGRTFTVTQSGAAGCSYSISPTSQSFGPTGGNGSVSVTTTAGCTWTASSNNAWIHVTSGSSGTGSGTVNYSVDANSGSARTGTMTIADHTFTVTQSGGGGGQTYSYQVAGVAHAGGAGGSVWRSTLCVTNRSGSPANLTLVYRMASNSVTRTHVLQNGRIKEWADVAVSLFNQSGNTSGAIEITSDAPVMVVARTYNEAPDGTFGQGMPGNEDSETLASGQMGVLPQLKKTSAFRTNVGLMNHGPAVCNVRIKLYSETGSQLGSIINTSVPAKQWKQINDVFNEAGVGQCAIGYATIEVMTAGGKIWAYGSVVDNGTGDPTTIPLFIE